jgi:hypothetical protein
LVRRKKSSFEILFSTFDFLNKATTTNTTKQWHEDEPRNALMWVPAMDLQSRC